MSQPQTSAGSGFPFFWIVGILVVGATACYFLFSGPGRPPNDPPGEKPVHGTDDPRLLYRGPFRNVHPEVREVGNAICASCHDAIADHYRQHPMGRSLLPIAKVIDSLALDEASRNPFTSDGYEHSIRRDGDRLFQREVLRDAKGATVFEREVEVEYAVGSGQKGYSFFSSRPGGYLYQTWISWYSQPKRWDLSPGFSRSSTSFQARPVLSACLDCHANRVEPVENTINRYEEPIFRGHSIGCERCHGPGELHVKEREAGAVVNGIDTSIVNPKHLSLDERESVCQQCHLEGEVRILHRDRKFNEFRPGMKLDSVMSIFTTAHQGADRKAVNHVEQMYLSQCFQKSDGKMGCATCHDPHQQVAKEKQVAYQTANCRKCHADCSVPLETRLQKQPDGYCVACHMPRFSATDIVHTATTNHQILRFGDKTKPTPPAFGSVPKLLLFPERPVDPANAEEVRDWAVASVWARSAAPSPLEALRRVQGSLERFPDDVELWLSTARTQEVLNSPRLAFDAYQQVLRTAPRHETALSGSAEIARRLNLADRSMEFLQRSVECNPWNWYDQAQLGMSLLEAGRVEEAKPHLDRWQMLNPGDPAGRFRLAEYHLRRGERDRAEELFRTVLPLAGKSGSEYERRWNALKGKR